MKFYHGLHFLVSNLKFPEEIGSRVSRMRKSFVFPVLMLFETIRVDSC